MARLGELFAQNLKSNRRKCGFSQEKLAEMVDVSTHHIAMMEIARSFPTLDLVERIAGALDIKIYELFIEPHAPSEELEQLRQEIRGDVMQLCNEVKQAVDASIQKALCAGPKAKGTA